MKELRAELTRLRRELHRTEQTAERATRKLENKIDKVELQLMEKFAGCERGDVVRYTSGKFFLPNHQYVTIGDYMQVVALGPLAQSLNIHMRLLEAPATYPRAESNSEVYFDGSPERFWRHFTKVGAAELKRVWAQIDQRKAELA